MVNFSQSMCVIVTGANRGYGRVLCTTIFSELQADSVMILVGRSKLGLEETRTQITHLNPSVKILIYDNFECADLNTQSFADFFDQNISIVTQVSTLFLVHNAGTVGDPSQKCSNLQLSQASQYMNVNFSSMVAANTIILDKLNFVNHKIIVNVSTLLAVQPGKSLSLYCSGKAARDMFFKVLALEEPSFRVLSYAPGAMDTAMFHKIRNTAYDDEMRNMFQGMETVNMTDSANKLLAVLKEDKFTSGDHLDFFDPMPGAAAESS